MRRDDYLDVALRIGRRLAGQAQWQGEECTWQVLAPDRENREKRASVVKTASGELYQGTAGMATFLGELQHLVGGQELARTALGAIRHALRLGEELPRTNFGFHAGRVGIAHAAYRLGERLGRPELAEEGLSLLEAMVGLENQDRGIDVIAGGAGAIPALLDLHSRSGAALPLEMAVALGDNLLQRTHREPAGWSWGTIGNSAARNLNGLAHGAAGFGLALLELASATGMERFRFGAEMAFLYERSSFSPEHSNWPDLRHQEIGDYLFYRTQEELREAARDGQIPPYRPKYMAAWCHGSPGIGLSRLRAFELTGQEVYRKEAEAALISTADSLEGNYSLCHGIAGNCELPLQASIVLCDEGLRKPCEECAEKGWELFEKVGKPWPCGTMNSEPDPSLLLGEAGIGLFYLRLYDPQAFTPLLLRPGRPQQTPRPDGPSFDEMRDLAVREYFGGTLRAFEALRQPLQIAWENGRKTPPRSPVDQAYASIREALDELGGQRRELLEDAFRVEEQRYLLCRELTDYTAEYLRRLLRTPFEEVDWQEAQFRRPELTQLVYTHYDWEAAQEAPPRRESATLLFRQSNRIQYRPVGALSAAMLEALESPLSADRLAAQIAADAGAHNPAARQSVAEKVRRQLRNLYQAGYIDCEREGSRQAAKSAK